PPTLPLPLHDALPIYVRGRDAGAHRAQEMDADDVGSEEVRRLAEHGGLGLDAAHAVVDDAQAVDHRRVRVGADERIRIVDAAARSEEHTSELQSPDHL